MPGEAPQQLDTKEEGLIRRVCNGEAEAFEELVRPYERVVFLTAISVLRNSADAEEVAQEAVLKAFANLPNFRAECKFSTWLVQITYNEARMKFERIVGTYLIPLMNRKAGKKATIRREILRIGGPSRPKCSKTTRHAKHWRMQSIHSVLCIVNREPERHPEFVHQGDSDRSRYSRVKRENPASSSQVAVARCFSSWN